MLSLLHQVPGTLRSLCFTAACYFAGLICYSLRGAQLESCTWLEPAGRVWVYSLACTLRLLETPHYRAKTFSTDIRANLRNVAIPGTGIPLHLFFWTRLHAWVFVCLLYPLAALTSAVFLSLHPNSRVTLADSFKQQLLTPTHWFARWRLNSWLAAWHAEVTRDTLSDQYAMENKGTFLLAAQAHGIPISPFLSNISCLFAKHVNMEGGLGIHVLRSFTHGGDWILQPALSNAPDLARLLPPGAPLSTLRVITASRHWLAHQPDLTADGVSTAPVQQLDQSGRVGGGLNGLAPTARDAAFSVMTVVLRAGRAGALTDHNCLCFPIDVSTGRLLPGRSNQHWYKLGLQHLGRIGETFGKKWTHHPDQRAGAGSIAGRHLNGIDRICALCTDAHKRLLPDVPLVGWDVALTAEHSAVLLELNISCNFFLGEVDQDWYTKFMTDFISALSKRQAL